MGQVAEEMFRLSKEFNDRIDVVEQEVRDLITTIEELTRIIDGIDRRV